LAQVQLEAKKCPSIRKQIVNAGFDPQKSVSGLRGMVAQGAVQIGTGDANAGQNYTLQSIAAVVLGGASIYGARERARAPSSARCYWPSWSTPCPSCSSATSGSSGCRA
jgi:hypothetical protein